MKNYLRYILLLLILGISAEMRSQTLDPSMVSFSKNKNYVTTLTPRAETSSVAYLNGKVTNYANANVQVSIRYLDGIGRPIQQVEYQASPSKMDLVTVQEYTAFTFLDKSWLPATITTKGAFVIPGSVTTQAKTDNVDTMPYSSFLYEEPVFERECEAHGPGQQWYTNQKAVKTEYLTNIFGDASLNCILFKVNGTGKNTTLAQSDNHPSGDLYVVRTIDEDQITSYAFTDKLGRQLLIRQVNKGVNHDTYYVYDDFNNLCFILSPRIQEEGIAQNKLDELAFQYKYDFRHRCISKKLPGCAPILCVYDKTDRLIFSQDGNQKGCGEWIFSIPDASGRTVLTGTCSDSIPITGKIVVAEFTGSGTYKGYVIRVNGSNQQLAGYKLLTVNYYDNYDFLGKNSFPSYTYDSSKEIFGFGKRYNANIGYEAKGLLTGSIVALLNGNGTDVIYAARYYDNRSRLIQQRTSNYIGGVETEYIAYNFVGQTTKLMHIHTGGGKATHTETYTYDYDHMGRLLTVKHKLNTLAEMILTNNTYDVLGRLVSKSLHGSATNKLTYAYNVRSWLKGIGGTNFTQNLYYTDGNNSTKCYNGNISSMTWKGSDGVTRGYKLSYDGLSRMMNAVYGETAAISTNLDRFSEKITGYDKNGNIKALQRYGQTAASAYGLIDNLAYTLIGNQLNRVDDAVTASAYNNGFEFKNGASAVGEYAYDANGNLSKDLNKGITGIQYNVLNLPNVVTFNGGSTITYTYGADGTKLRTVHKIDGATTTTDYCGNVIYENGTAKWLLTEEGYVSLSDNKYHYYLKDHQGNNRVVINQAGAVEETNHYYPFGGTFANNTTVQPYKYNGKELDTKKGLNWHDYEARHYDGALGRFTTIDPLAEKYYSVSPYAYCLNNPVKFIDPDGCSIRVVENGDGTYRVVGGDLDDNDKSIYAYDFKNNKVNIRIVGTSLTGNSFFGDDGKAVIGATINTKDQSGQNFIDDEIIAGDPNILSYMFNATGGEKYDFKTRGNENMTQKQKDLYSYRGMPFKDANGNTVYASARDIGNYGAGYIAGKAGLNWRTARMGFDALESSQRGKFSTEGMTTQRAERFGYNAGSSNYQLNRASDHIKRLFNIPTSKPKGFLGY